MSYKKKGKNITVQTIKQSLAELVYRSSIITCHSQDGARGAGAGRRAAEGRGQEDEDEGQNNEVGNYCPMSVI